ncbi:copper amine oxidase N-terminal domain-containing protein [Natranaerobius thermophilus]|uniref:Copper amine oxidase domain protein n=1 Tax=Natranaerobius thermophilus (strain ATCC BAA-1301 / DSM 18059 / JW/NM-WN-LF) TaxID=457570 RepID=B2A5C9_NATTJ|nr:copper amine oxidase N-terminal domain-containing protein [Natranaerobius thermophilus]ACB83963.1 copper amine oxidase domain protein [Natranaerobius thermophilus JW/NM-WN-LF]
MKKFTMGLIVGILLSLSVSGTASHQEISLFVDNEEIEPDVVPQMIDGRVMVPARFVAEPLGASVEWDGQNNKVLISSDDQELNGIEEEDKKKEDKISLREFIEEYGEEYNLTVEGDGYVYRNDETLFNWEEEGETVDGRIYIPEILIEETIAELETSKTTEEEMDSKSSEGKKTAQVGEALKVEGLEITINDISYSVNHEEFTAQDGREFAIISFTIVNESAESNDWASVGNWDADAYDDHGRYDEWKENFSYRASSPHPEVSEWIYEGEELSSEVRFNVFEGMQLNEIHYNGISNKDIVFEK